MRDREEATFYVALVNLLLTLFLYVLLTMYHFTYIKPLKLDQELQAIDLDELRIDKAARDQAGRIIVVNPKESEP